MRTTPGTKGNDMTGPITGGAGTPRLPAGGGTAPTTDAPKLPRGAAAASAATTQALEGAAKPTPARTTAAREATAGTSALRSAADRPASAGLADAAPSTAEAVETLGTPSRLSAAGGTTPDSPPTATVPTGTPNDTLPRDADTLDSMPPAEVAQLRNDQQQLDQQLANADSQQERDAILMQYSAGVGEWEGEAHPYYYDEATGQVWLLTVVNGAVVLERPDDDETDEATGRTTTSSDVRVLTPRSPGEPLADGFVSFEGHEATTRDASGAVVRAEHTETRRIDDDTWQVTSTVQDLDEVGRPRLTNSFEGRDGPVHVVSQDTWVVTRTTAGGEPSQVEHTTHDSIGHDDHGTREVYSTDSTSVIDAGEGNAIDFDNPPPARMTSYSERYDPPFVPDAQDPDSPRTHYVLEAVFDAEGNVIGEVVHHNRLNEDGSWTHEQGPRREPEEGFATRALSVGTQVLGWATLGASVGSLVFPALAPVAAGLGIASAVGATTMWATGNGSFADALVGIVGTKFSGLRGIVFGQAAPTVDDILSSGGGDPIRTPPWVKAFEPAAPYGPPVPDPQESAAPTATPTPTSEPEPAATPSADEEGDEAADAEPVPEAQEAA